MPVEYSIDEDEQSLVDLRCIAQQAGEADGFNIGPYDFCTFTLPGSTIDSEYNVSGSESVFDS